MTPVDRYLVEFESLLHGSRREKRDLVREVSDHLDDASQARVDDGATPHEAQTAAVREFGAVHDIAPSYQAVLSAGRCRRISIWLIALVVVQPLAWDVFGSMPVNDASDHSPSTLYTLADAYVEVVGSAAVLLAAIILVAGRFAFRWIGIHEWMLRLSLTAILVSTALIVLVSTAMFASSAEMTAVNVAYAAVVSWIPLGLLCTACVRALRAIDLSPPCDRETRIIPTT